MTFVAIFAVLLSALTAVPIASQPIGVDQRHDEGADPSPSRQATAPDVDPLRSSQSNPPQPGPRLSGHPADQQAALRPRSQTTALVAVTVISPHLESPIEDAVVVIEGDRISSVGRRPDTQIPQGATVINAEGKWVMPGLVDSHIHFFQSGGLYTRPDVVDLRFHKPYEEELEDLRSNLPETLRRYLASGITSVVDVGGPMWNLGVRAMADTLIAPRVVVAGPLISSVQPSALTTDHPPILRVESPDEARRIVREQVEAGVDLVKIWYIVRPGETPEAFRPVARATIDEAHLLGTRVAVHATQLETARAAVEEGADILVHSVFYEPVDEAFIQLLKENDVVYTPTLMVTERYGDVFAQEVDLHPAEHELADPWVVSSWYDLPDLPQDSLPSGLVNQMRNGEPAEPSNAALANLDRLYEAGVTIAAGTDAGNIGTPHGPSLFYEMELMEEAGLTPKEVISTATLGGAKLMGRSDDLGTIQPGKLADLLVLDANPLEDVSNTSKINRVIRGGDILEPEDLINPTPEEVVQRQVNAYNAGDIDAFAQTYAHDVRIYGAADSLLMSGRETLHQQYKIMFGSAPELHVEITDRLVLGDFVFDREHVTGLPNGAAIEGTAAYRVEDGLIKEVWFVIPDE